MLDKKKKIMYFKQIGLILCAGSLLTFVSTDLNADVESSVREIIDQFYDVQAVRPVENPSDTVDVNISWNLVSINDFDETNGFIEVSGYVTLEWNMTAFTAAVKYNGTENVSNNKLWKPPVLLVNSLKHYDEIGSGSNIKVVFDFSTRRCTWKPWVISRVACSPNVQYYPFDKQSCSLKFAVWGYNSEEVRMTPKSLTWTFDYFEENGEWFVNDTSAESYDENNISTAEFKVSLSRRPLYYVINLIAPVVLLGVLNSFSFWLPVASGERIGFAVTCFLTYVVLLNTIMNYLPTSSTPFSNLSYFTFIMMVFSAVASLLTIFTVRIHHKDEEGKVPRWLAKIFFCCGCKCCCSSSNKTKRNKVKPSNNVTTIWEDEPSVSDWSESTTNTNNTDNVSGDDENNDADNVKWSDVAPFLDKLMFVSFLGGQIFFSVAYLSVLFVSSDLI